MDETLVMRIKNTIEDLEEPVSIENSDYENGHIDGLHDAYVDVLNMMKIPHTYQFFYNKKLKGGI